MRSIKCAVVLLLAMMLSACATTDPVASRKFADPAQALTRIEVVYHDNNLHKPGLAASMKKDDELEWVKYYKLAGLFAERAPAFFRANGLDAKVVTLPPPIPGEAAPETKLEAATLPRMNIRFASGYSQQGRVFLYLTSALNDVPKDGKAPRLWQGEFRLALGVDQAFGAFRINKVDAAFVDEMLTAMLEKMAADGVISLPGGKARKPEPAAS